MTAARSGLLHPAFAWALGISQDCQLVAVHSGKCVDVSNVSTTAGAKIHQGTCDPASNVSTSAGSPHPGRPG